MLEERLRVAETLAASQRTISAQGLVPFRWLSHFNQR